MTVSAEWSSFGGWAGPWESESSSFTGQCIVSSVTTTGRRIMSMLVNAITVSLTRDTTELVKTTMILV